MTPTPSLHMTPVALAEDILSLIPSLPGDSYYEPFKGEGSFYDAMPSPKSYTEIDEGSDFFNYQIKHDWIITNPPFRIIVTEDSKPTSATEVNMGDGMKRVNGFIPCVEKALTLADKGAGFLVNHKCMNTLTNKRLNDWNNLGFAISIIKVYEVKKWFGRYFFILFVKGGKWCLDFDRREVIQNE